MSLGPIGTNCYIVYEGKNAIIFDPGAEPTKILDFVNQQKLKVGAILLTHAHFDHIGALEDVRNHTGANVYVHEQEMSWLSDPQLNGSQKLIGTKIIANVADAVLTPGPKELATFSFSVIHTPGHSPGSVSFVFEKEQFIISGDVLFYQGIGRTDLPGGDMDVLVSTIRNKLYTLDDHYTVYPGHGPKTSIEQEKQRNPFVQGGRLMYG